MYVYVSLCRSRESVRPVGQFDGSILHVRYLLTSADHCVDDFNKVTSGLEVSSWTDVECMYYILGLDQG